jgi:hypothetical protein
MGLWFRVVRRLSGTLAREALVELAAIVSRAANAVGERVSVTESK